ncbi:MAG: hypothetical protein H6Q59_2812 [Firmicutes bacterium]|nr:hypothetical protein [Bacillota bacterium]
MNMLYIHDILHEEVEYSTFPKARQSTIIFKNGGKHKCIINNMAIRI